MVIGCKGANIAVISSTFEQAAQYNHALKRLPGRRNGLRCPTALPSTTPRRLLLSAGYHLWMRVSAGRGETKGNRSESQEGGEGRERESRCGHRRT